MRVPWLYVGAAAAVAGALIYVKTTGAKSVGASIGSAAVDLATGVLSGVAEPITRGVGYAADAATDNDVGHAFQKSLSWFGIPETNLSECEKAKTEGRTWDASFACPAGDFIGYLWD
jgi:hypothetical protein